MGGSQRRSCVDERQRIGQNTDAPLSHLLEQWLTWCKTLHQKNCHHLSGRTRFLFSAFWDWATLLHHPHSEWKLYTPQCVCETFNHILQADCNDAADIAVSKTLRSSLPVSVAPAVHLHIYRKVHHPQVFSVRFDLLRVLTLCLSVFFDNFTFKD